MADPHPQPTLFCITGIDKPGLFETRLATRQAHLDHWGALGDRLVLAGPFLDADGKPCGSMIVIKAETQAEAEALAAKDPYRLAGVFDDAIVRRWMWFFNAPESL